MINRDKFIEILEETLEKDKSSIKLDDQFRDYDEWDSLSILAVGSVINDEFDIVIPRNEFEKLITINDLCSYIESKTS